MISQIYDFTESKIINIKGLSKTSSVSHNWGSGLYECTSEITLLLSDDESITWAMEWFKLQYKHSNKITSHYSSINRDIKRTLHIEKLLLQGCLMTSYSPSGNDVEAIIRSDYEEFTTCDYIEYYRDSKLETLLT